MNLLRFWDFEKLDCDLVVSQVETDLYDNELAALGIRRVVTLTKRYASPIRRILHNLFAMNALLKQGDYNAIYFNLSNSFTMIYAWRAKLAGVQVRVVHSHCSGIQKSAMLPLKKLGHNIGRFLFTASATQCLACSPEAALWLFGWRRVQQGDVKLIHNAVSVERFLADNTRRQNARRNLGLEGKWVIGTVGRLTGLKNTDFLIRVFRHVCASREDAFLLVIGEGELREHLITLVKELGISDKVWLYGVTNDVPQMLWAMDVFCLPSCFEGNPVSVIEAQAAGCICLVSDRVTQQCKVSDNVRFLPIDQGVVVWAEAIQSAHRVCSAEQAARQVIQNGYDAAAMSAEIQALLSGALHSTKDSREERI